MTKEYRAKVFKSGNSHALRLPRELGIADGEEMIVVAHGDGRFTMWKQTEALDVLMGLYGSMSPGFMRDGRGDIEQADRHWARKADRSAA